MRFVALAGLMEPSGPRLSDVAPTGLVAVMPPSLYGGKWLNLYRWDQISHYVKLAGRLQPNQRVPVGNLEPGRFYMFSVETFDPGPPPASWMSKLEGATTPLEMPVSNDSTGNDQTVTDGPRDVIACIADSIKNRRIEKTCIVPIGLIGLLVVGIFWLKN